MSSQIKAIGKEAVLRILKQGPVPQHMAFILDGNRRYARKSGMDKVIQGHRAGFHKLDEVVDYCISLGIGELTAYVFSLENFKRSKEEVMGLMNLIVEIIPEYTKKLHKIGARVNVTGSWTETFPSEIKTLFADTMMTTRNNSKINVNFAASYTARDEIATGVQNVIGEVSRGILDLSDIDEQTLEECFQAYSSTPVDLLLRTSGETRLSDFLLWQSSHAFLDFIQVDWPALSFWDFVSSIWRYQQHKVHLPLCFEEHREQKSIKNLSDQDKRRQQAIEAVRAEKWQKIVYYSSDAKDEY